MSNCVCDGSCCVPVWVDKAVFLANQDKLQPSTQKERRGMVMSTKPDGMCGFLQPNRLCGIYESRPKLCVDFGRTPQHPCFYKENQ